MGPDGERMLDFKSVGGGDVKVVGASALHH